MDSCDNYGIGNLYYGITVSQILSWRNMDTLRQQTIYMIGMLDSIVKEMEQGIYFTEDEVWND